MTRSEETRAAATRRLLWGVWAVCLDLASLCHGLMILWLLNAYVRTDEFWIPAWQRGSEPVDTSPLEGFFRAWAPIELFLALGWLIAVTAGWWVTMRLITGMHRPVRRAALPRVGTLQ